MLSRVPVPCPECHQTVKVRTEYLGLRVLCKHCGHPFSVPRVLQVACPVCGLGGRFRTDDLGRVIRCNRCDTVYEALPGVDVKITPNPWEGASRTGERNEMCEPPPMDGLHPATVGCHRADRVGCGDDGRSTRLAALEAARDDRSGPDAGFPGDGLESTDGREQDWVDEVVQGTPAVAGQANREHLSLADFGVIVEHPPRDTVPTGELDEARSQLDRLRVEVDSLRIRASEAERLGAECVVLKEQASEQTRREDELRSELEGIRSELERLGSEAAAVRDRAASAERLEDELRAATEEVARLRSDCRDAQAAAAAATGEFEALLAHSSTLQDGFYEALAEIEKDSAERLIPPREAERLRARLGELEGLVAESLTARRALEEDFACTLQAREHELATVREEVRTLHARMRELAELEAEEKRLKEFLARERVANDQVAAEPAESMGPAVGRRDERGGERADPSSGLAEASRPGDEPTARSKAPAIRIGGSDGISALRMSGDMSAPVLDLALELIELPDLLPRLMDLRGAQPTEAAPETPDPAIVSVVATELILDRGTPARPGPAADPDVDVDSLAAEAHRLKAEILGLMSQGRKKDAEILSRRMVDLIRAIAGELSPDYSTWTTVVGQLQAEQGDWPGARSTFDRKNAIFRNEFGELDPRYLSSLADSAEALLACGDRVGAEILFAEAEAICRRTLDADHPRAIAIRGKLDGLRRQWLEFTPVRILT